MFDALDIARCLTGVGHDPQSPDDSVKLCPLRLQKLLYYCQGWSLSLLEKPLFKQDIQAWKHGPVVKDVYDATAGKRSGIEPDELGPLCEPIPETVQSFIQMIWKEYARYLPRELIEMTHREPAWLEARQGLAAEAQSSNPLSLQTMGHHFRGLTDQMVLDKFGASRITPQESWQAAIEDEQPSRTVSLEEIRQRTQALRVG